MEPSTSKKIPTIPRLRMLKSIFTFISNPIPILNQYIEEVGDTYYMYMGGQMKSIMTANPHIIQHVLQKNHRNYRKSPIQVDQLAHYVGQGLLTSEGAYWLKQRRLIQPGFHRNKLAALVDIMGREIDLFLDQMDQEVPDGQPFDMVHKMHELAFIVVAKSLFSTGVEKELLNRLSDNITQIQSFIVQEIRQPYLKAWFNLSGKKRRMEQMGEDSKKIILQVIQQRRDSGQRQDDLLDMLLEARYEDTGEGMNDTQLLEESLIIFIAGHETSANALAWTWYILSQHPDVLLKVRKEIEEHLGKRKATAADLPKLTYLTQVIQESMRIYPPAWITDRVPNEDDEIEGYQIPKDVLIGVYIYGVHHSPKYWENPSQFDPSRFEKDKIKSRPSYAYMPFGGGPRLCIGNNFAMMEMQLILIRMIQRYEIKLLDQPAIEMMPLVTLRPKNGIQMNKTRK